MDFNDICNKKLMKSYCFERQDILILRIMAGPDMLPVYTAELQRNYTSVKNSDDNKTSFQDVLDNKINSTDISSGRESSDIKLSGENTDPITVPSDLMKIFKKAADEYGVDEGILISMAKQESDFHANALSKSNAAGIMQLMPATQKAMGVNDPFDPEENIMGGARLMKSLIDKYDGNVILALAAYGTGSGNVKKYGGIPPFEEIQKHIPKVLSNYIRGYVSSDGTDRSAPKSTEIERLLDEYKNAGSR